MAFIGQLTLCWLFFIIQGCCIGADLEDTYPFSVSLVEDTYHLYWNFSKQHNSIKFAVRVKTTGWIGFGLSPGGQMEGSDVVIGWIGSDGQTYLHDRFAFEQKLPPIDPIQNWFLANSKVQDGYTTLEFMRDFITCDDRDREIHVDTSRVVFAWNDNTPSVTRNSDGSESYSISQHQTRGSTSINLLGGLPSPPNIPEDANSFTISVNEVEIPAVETEYYCQGMQLSEEIRNEEQYIIKVSPAISESSSAYVHHILVYICDGLSEQDLGKGGSCDSDVSYRVKSCLASLLIAAWAIGGSDFVYPENVAYPIGGPYDKQYVVIQIHYNNPNLDSGVTDSSGLSFTYINTPREHDAGILFLGHAVVPTMIIPPGASNFTITSMCSDTCTNQYFPSDGIHVFASMLHTHLIGIGLELSVVDDTVCSSGESRVEQSAMIDSNLNYDFNFQQATHLPQEIIVKPGTTLLLNCYYDSSHRIDATLGGESTTQEMCLTFPVYYPRIKMSHCTSQPSLSGFITFIQNFVPDELKEQFSNLNPGTSLEELTATLGLLEWNDDQLKGYYDSFYTHNLQTAGCRGGNGYESTYIYPPKLCCAYETTNQCTGRVPVECCDRACLGSGGGAAAHKLCASVVIIVLSLVVTLASLNAL